MNAKRIILVDDEAYLTSTVAAKLRKAGYEVEIAGNGEDGFALVSAHPPSLLITDNHMPGMSGYQMSARLKEHPATSSVPVLMLSGHGHQISPEELAKTNICCMFPKPFSARELLAKVEEIIGGRVIPLCRAAGGDGGDSP